MTARGRHARPRGRLPRWYRLPMPLAALAVVAMPWVAVRDVRQADKAFTQLLDIMLAAYRRGQLAAPGPKHLYVVM